MQPPAIYRLFDDKVALREAVAERVMAEFAASKAAIAEAATADETDPLEDLRAGCNLRSTSVLPTPPCLTA